MYLLNTPILYVQFPSKWWQKVWGAVVNVHRSMTRGRVVHKQSVVVVVVVASVHNHVYLFNIKYQLVALLARRRRHLMYTYVYYYIEMMDKRSEQKYLQYYWLYIRSWWDMQWVCVKNSFNSTKYLLNTFTRRQLLFVIIVNGNLHESGTFCGVCWKEVSKNNNCDTGLIKKKKTIKVER